MVYIHFICGSKTNQVLYQIQPAEKKAREGVPTSSHLPQASRPAMLLTLPSNLAVAPSLTQRFLGGKMKAGASVRGMEPALEGSILKEVLETCVEEASFTSPMVCKEEGRPGQMKQKVQRRFPSGSSGPSVLIGPQRCGFYRECVPIRSGSTWSSSLGMRGSVSSIRKAARVRPSQPQMPAPRAMPQPPQIPMENF